MSDRDKSPCYKCENLNRRYCSAKCQALADYRKMLDSADIETRQSTLSGTLYCFIK